MAQQAADVKQAPSAGAMPPGKAARRPGEPAPAAERSLPTMASLLASGRRSLFWPLFAVGAGAVLLATLGAALLAHSGAGPLSWALEALALLAVTAGVARQLQRRLARALRIVTRRANLLTLRHSGVVPLPGRTELGNLAASFDAMTQALERDLGRTRAALRVETQNGVDLQRQFALMQLLRNLASQANGGEDLTQVLQGCLEEIGDYLDWPIGRLVLLERDARGGQTVRLQWYARDSEHYAAFIEACAQEARRGVAGGMVARAVGSSLPHWVSDLERLDPWPAYAPARDCGLHTGFVIPVALHAQRTALVEFYADHHLAAGPEMLELVEAISAELWQGAQRFERAAATAAVAQAPAADSPAGRTNPVPMPQAGAAAADSKAPAGPAGAASEPVGMDVASAPGNLGVLVAEDNAVNREVVRAMLQALGCRATLVEDGLAALQQLERQAFDLVLMDCQMPVLDGFDTLRRMRNSTVRSGPLAAARSTPVVAVTGDALAGDEQRCRAAGFDDYLAKPFTRAQLREVLLRWTARRAATVAPAAEVPRPAAPMVPTAAVLPIVGEADAGEVAVAAAPAPPVEAEAPVLDAKIFEQIRGMQLNGAPDLLARLIAVFESSAGALLRDGQRALDASDAAALERSLHTLKSSSGNLGAARLAAACARTSLALRTQGVGEAGRAWPALLEESRRALAALRERAGALVSGTPGVA